MDPGTMGCVATCQLSIYHETGVSSLRCLHLRQKLLPSRWRQLLKGPEGGEESGDVLWLNRKWRVLIAGCGLDGGHRVLGSHVKSYTLPPPERSILLGVGSQDHENQEIWQFSKRTVESESDLCILQTGPPFHFLQACVTSLHS